MDDGVTAPSVGADAPLAGEAPAYASVVAAGNEDSDWEYEYSTTETETHLITLDLSIPEFLRGRGDHIVHNTRGGFRSWMNPLMVGGDDNDGDDEQPKGREGGPRPPKGSIREALGEDGNDDEGREESDDNVGDNIEGNNDPSDRDEEAADEDLLPKDGANKTAAEEPDPAEIQILDLHGARPVVAYRGMVFAGAWAEPIGTEMLFTTIANHNEDTNKTTTANSTMLPPPPLSLSTRRLTDDIELLGASSARIQCATVELRPRKKRAPSPAQNEERTQRPKFRIPVSHNAAEPRRKQAQFLERLMAAKNARGETDAVTVQAVETTQDAVRGDAGEAARRRMKRQQAVRHQRRQQRRKGQRGEEIGGGTQTRAQEGSNGINEVTAPRPAAAIQSPDRENETAMQTQATRTQRQTASLMGDVDPRGRNSHDERPDQEANDSNGGSSLTDLSSEEYGDSDADR